MIGLVIVTHGRLAEEFLYAMEHVVGPQAAGCQFVVVEIGNAPRRPAQGHAVASIMRCHIGPD